MADELTTDPAPSKGSGKKMQFLIIACLMLGEGVAVYFLANALGPAPVAGVGAEGDGGEAAADAETTFSEIELAKCLPFNMTSGKLITFRMTLIGLVPSAELENAEELVKSKKSRILDRVNYVVRSAELHHLNEPELETLRRRIKKELDRIFDDPDFIKEVVIPEFQPSGSGV